MFGQDAALVLLYWRHYHTSHYHTSHYHTSHYHTSHRAITTQAKLFACFCPPVIYTGALFGLGAALALFYWRHKHLLKGQSDKVLRSLGITLALNLGYSLLVKNIDNW